MKRQEKVTQRSKRCNRKIRKTAHKRQRKAQRKLKRPRRTLLAHRHFYSLEAFIRFLHKFLSDLLEKKLPAKAAQAVFGWSSLLIALVLRSLLGIAHLSHLVEELENNPSLWRAIGFRRALKNSKPLTELLLRLSLPLATWLFVQVALEMRAHGLLFGKSVSIDSCFLHIWGNSYENTGKGYSGQLKRTADGYKFWVAFSVESRMPLSFCLDKGKLGDTTYFQGCIARAAYILGPGTMKMVVADRGFCSRELYWWLDKVMHVHFVIRAKMGETNAYIQGPLDALQASDFHSVNQYERYAKTEVMGFRDSRYRLWVGKNKRFKNPLLLLTNAWDLHWKAVKKIYLSRWKVESYFASEKGNFALGKFSTTKWAGVCGEVVCSLLASMLCRVFCLLLGKRYRSFGSSDLQARVFLHGFEETFEELLRPSRRRNKPLIAALQRVFAFLEQWESLEKPERFAHCRPALFEPKVFELLDLSVITQKKNVSESNG